jgi:probable O-glycosylation ligase (exosortase A-associated)
MTGGQFRLYGPDRSMIADNNDFGLALNMTLPLYFFLAQAENRPWLKRFWAFMFLITIPAIFFTYSRGALVGLVGVSLLLFMQSRRRAVLIPVMALAVAVAIFFAPEAWRERMNPTREDAVDASAQSRLHAWAYARALAADYPITGGGFATFTPELYDRYAPTQGETTYGAHSVYFQVLAEHGYVGLALYLTLLLISFRTLSRIRKAALAAKEHGIALYAQMFQFSLTAFVISGTFLGRAYFDYYFTIIACVAILELVGRERGIKKVVHAIAPPPRAVVAPALPRRPAAARKVPAPLS